MRSSVPNLAAATFRRLLTGCRLQTPRAGSLAIADVGGRKRRVHFLPFRNPRHEHEWRVWQDVKLPQDKILIPGVISNSTVVIEHPEVVAERILRFTGVVGPERVIAGSDCSFATSAGSKEFAPTVVWEKLKALSEGARIASTRLT